MSNVNGIQIIGTQRSGSNLLRVMLDQSTEITALHPPHILSSFAPLLKFYEPMTVASYRDLVSDVVEYIRFNPVLWEGVTLDPQHIVDRSSSHSLFELFKIIYEEAAISRGSRYWCCKSMVNFKYFRQLESEDIRLKYIYLYRDGRDVAVSFKKAVVGEKHVYALAKQWAADQQACIELASELGPERCYSLRYEDLIHDPARSVKNVCNFLGIEYKPEMLHYYTSRESQNTASSGKMWSNLTQPVLQNNHNKFLKELSELEIEIFELVGGQALKQLGYELHTSCSRQELMSPELVASYDSKNKMLKELVQQENAADFNTRNGQRLVLENVKARTVKSTVVL